MTREQFIRQVECTQTALRRFLCALCCGDFALADDLAQETYVKAYLAYGDCKEPDKFAAWLRRIAYNTFVSYKRSVRLSADYDEAREVYADSSADGAFRYEELYRALNKLSEKERTAVLLFYLENYSIKEIAAIIDATTDAVKQQLSRGRTHLKEFLQKSNYNFNS